MTSEADSPNPRTRRATCACGQLALVTHGEPIRVSVCHCLACQKRSGSVFATQARFHDSDVQVTGEAREFVRTGDSGDAICAWFCPHCGSTVWYMLESQPAIRAVPVGAFADPGFPPPARSVYESRRHAWVGLPDDMVHEA